MDEQEITVEIPQDGMDNTPLSSDIHSSNPHEPFVYSIGTVVEVMARCWVGSNKPGGVGRIRRVHHDPGSFHLLPFMWSGN